MRKRSGSAPLSPGAGRTRGYSLAGPTALSTLMSVVIQVPVMYQRTQVDPGSDEFPAFSVNAKRTEALSLLGLWHLCSLDAPSVAALWVWFIAYAYGVPLPWTSSAGMFVAVWMLYAADRLLDGRAHASRHSLEERHHFHGRHRNRFVLGLSGCSCLMAGLMLKLSRVELRLYTTLGFLLVAYFFLIHVWSSKKSRSKDEHRRIPKELAVGLFFPAAVFIPTVSRTPELRYVLLPSAILFALACTLNCLYVYTWEHPSDRSEAHWTTQYAVGNLRLVSICALVLCVIAASSTRWMGGVSLVATACGLSVLALLAVDLLRHRLTALTVRASADLALLSPLLLILLSAALKR